MITHEIKILLNHYDRVKAGTKTFEIRKNDRYYQKGDQVVMGVVIPEEGSFYQTDYPKITATVGDVYPIHEDFVVFSLLGVK